MIRRSGLYLLALVSVFILSGCVVRTYQLTKDRVDQDLSEGNRGYIKGDAPKEIPERKTTRTTQVVEVEITSPIKFEKKPKVRSIEQTKEEKTAESDDTAMGNKGYITQSLTPEITEPRSTVTASDRYDFESYTVKKGDTLQKISKKFFGTTKKWIKIYDANRDALKNPNKLFPGQVINIPIEGLKETQENLK